MLVHFIACPSNFAQAILHILPKMCHITHVANTLCVHAAKEVRMCRLQDVRSIFSYGLGNPFDEPCKSPTSAERWDHDLCAACKTIWTSHSLTEQEAKLKILEYRIAHQYHGPLTPIADVRGTDLHIVEDESLTENQRRRWKSVWEHNQRHHQKGRTEVSLDENVEFTKTLLRWAHSAEGKELPVIRQVSSTSKSNPEWNASTITLWPQNKATESMLMTDHLDRETDTVARQLKGMEVSEGPARVKSRLWIHFDEFDIVDLDSHTSVGDKDGFEPQTLSSAPWLTAGKAAQRTAPSKAPQRLAEREIHSSYRPSVVEKEFV